MPLSRPPLCSAPPPQYKGEETKYEKLWKTFGKNLKMGIIEARKRPGSSARSPSAAPLRPSAAPVTDSRATRLTVRSFLFPHLFPSIPFRPQDASNRGRLSKLLRFTTSQSEGKLTSLDSYLKRMKPGQKFIFYVAVRTRGRETRGKETPCPRFPVCCQR